MPEVRAVSNHLARIKGERPFPRRSDLRPEDMPPSAFPRLFLVSVEQHADGKGGTRLRFFYRLVGDRISHATGAT
jgi:hypothetical protein